MAQKISNLPIGARVKFGKHKVASETAQPIVWRIADKNHSGYPSDSVTLITDAIIDILSYDSTEVDNNLGNANYAYSNIDQWLNSNGNANEWYRATHNQDNTPNYSSRPAFLYHFSENERLALLPTNITVQLGSNVSSRIVRSVFLPSAWEILGGTSTIDGSSRFTNFVSNDVRACLSTQVYENMSGTKPATIDTPYSYMTRSTEVSTSSGVYYVLVMTTSGGTTWGSPRDASGVRPCVNISLNTKVSDTPDASGCYEVLFNTAPVISEENADMGERDTGFVQTYTVNDNDADNVVVTEYIDNVEIRSYIATPGSTSTFDVTGKTWLKLANGVHTLKIIATDGFDTVTRTFTFTKSVKSLIVQKVSPIVSSTMPKSIIVSVVKNIPTEAIFKVEACNNGFDDNPTWEDITFGVVNGEIYDFTNTTKTAGQWGVNIRVTVDRNGSEGACYITEIGGNFE